MALFSSDRFGALGAHRDFVSLWIAQSVSAFGSRITRTALPVIAILLVTSDPVQLSIVGALTMVPDLVVGLFAGGFIDRHAKRPILIGADLVRAVLVFSVPVAAWTERLTIEQLYVVAALVGFASALFRLAHLAYLPILIGREHLIEGNSKLETTDSIAEIGGPGLAGVLIQWLTAPIALVVDAASYLWSAAFLGRIRAREALAGVAHAKGSVVDDIRIGVRAGFGHPIVGPMFWSFAIGDLFGGFYATLYTLYALETLKLGVATLGVVISLGGVSALAGAFVAARLSRRLGFGRALLATAAFGKATGIFVPLAAAFPSASVLSMSASQLLGDGAMVAFLILAGSYRQAVLPIDVMARANGMLAVMTGTLTPLGALLAGALASTTSTTAAVWVAAIGGVASLAPLLRRSIYRIAAIPGA